MAGELSATIYRLGTTQTVSTSGTSAATSNAMASGTYAVRVVCTEACHIAVGASPTATTSFPLLPANTVEYIAVRAGEKVAAIQNSTGGTLFVTEVS